jgi:hypothetical protein
MHASLEYSNARNYQKEVATMASELTGDAKTMFTNAAKALEFSLHVASVAETKAAMTNTTVAGTPNIPGKSSGHFIG